MLTLCRYMRSIGDMAKLKRYQFKDGNTYTSNKAIIEALGESPHIRQVSASVTATSKKEALEFFRAVGFGRHAEERHLALSDPRDEELPAEGTVLIAPLLRRNGQSVISLTPTDDYLKPTITVVTVYGK